MRTITLELVRHGPAHNQLISPLTQYLALCENHPAVTLQLPLEHNQMLYRLSALAYRMGREPREFQLQDTSRLLGNLLALIPGLTADMNRREAGQGDDDATHLRLVLSASELAMLPFELALAPAGFPGSGQPILLQSLSPLTLTRETRRVAEDRVLWPERARVLFVVASPADLPPPPAAAHLLALRKILEPWVGTRKTSRDTSLKQKLQAPKFENSRLDEHLTIITEAALEDIETACSIGDYTHVHILAHGGEYTDGYDTRFGILLHNKANPKGLPDCVSGERLATALRTSRKGSSGQLARPSVVTLASCYSGNVRSVTGVGASIAHALHADGIPLVIASQFPLSFGGSIRMVEVLYEGLLWGEDPRRLLIDLRRVLHTQFPDTHDWASITAYSSLPPSFEYQLERVQIQRARDSVTVALDLADEIVSRVDRSDRRSQSATFPSEHRSEPQASVSDMSAAMRRVREARARLSRLLDRFPSQKSRIVALLASADKREASLEYETLKFEALEQNQSFVSPDLLAGKVWPLLERARKHYDEAFSCSATWYWAVVQYISLTVVMRYGGRLVSDTEIESRDIGKLWMLAEVQSLHDLSSEEFTWRVWALGNLIELYLLVPVIVELQDIVKIPFEECKARAIKYARDLATMERPGTFEVYSTRRQIVRYLDLYAELCPMHTIEPAMEIAEVVVKLLPEEHPNKHRSSQ